MNVRRADDGYRLRIDLPTIRALMDDYAVQDLWHVLEQPAIAKEIHCVLGGRSDTVPARDQKRLQELASKTDTVALHVLERAGHWVHADDPEGLLELVAAALGPPNGRSP